MSKENIPHMGIFDTEKDLQSLHQQKQMGPKKIVGIDSKRRHQTGYAPKKNFGDKHASSGKKKKLRERSPELHPGALPRLLRLLKWFKSDCVLWDMLDRTRKGRNREKTGQDRQNYQKNRQVRRVQRERVEKNRRVQGAAWGSTIEKGARIVVRAAPAGPDSQSQVGRGGMERGVVHKMTLSGNLGNPS